MCIRDRPSIDTVPGVFLGKALVTNDGNTGKVLAINTNEEDVTIEIKPCELIPCGYNVAEFDLDSSSEEECIPINNPEERIHQILDILNLEALNNEEKEQVRLIVEKYHDLLRLPGDKLSCTDQVEHKIPTKNNISVHT